MKQVKISYLSILYFHETSRKNELLVLSRLKVLKQSCLSPHPWPVVLAVYVYLNFRSTESLLHLVQLRTAIEGVNAGQITAPTSPPTLAASVQTTKLLSAPNGGTTTDDDDDGDSGKASSPEGDVEAGKKPPQGSPSDPASEEVRRRKGGTNTKSQMTIEVEENNEKKKQAKSSARGDE